MAPWPAIAPATHAHAPARLGATLLATCLLVARRLAQGMGVPASRAATCEELAAALRAALVRQGPSLIEAVL